MNPMVIQNEIQKWNWVKEALIAHGLEEDDQTLFDTLDGATKLIDVIVLLMKEAKLAECSAEGVKNYIGELQKRKERLENKAKVMRGLVLRMMEETGQKNIKLPEFTLSVSPTPSKVIVTNEATIPPEYLKTKTEPNLTAIKDALKEGASIPGATLSNGGSTLKVTTR